MFGWFRCSRYKPNNCIAYEKGSLFINTLYKCFYLPNKMCIGIICQNPEHTLQKNSGVGGGGSVFFSEKDSMQSLFSTTWRAVPLFPASLEWILLWLQPTHIAIQ